MATRNLTLVIIAIGIISFVSGVYGLGSQNFSIIILCLGALFIVGGAISLALAVRPWHLSLPHSFVMGITFIAAGLHAYEQIYQSAGNPSPGYWLWSMMPYALCLVLSSFSYIRISTILGAALSLAFDLWGYYVVFINPQSSTAALALLFIPLWSTIIVIPLGTYVAWLIIRIKKPQWTAP